MSICARWHPAGHTTVQDKACGHSTGRKIALSPRLGPRPCHRAHHGTKKPHDTRPRKSRGTPLRPDVQIISPQSAKNLSHESSKRLCCHQLWLCSTLTPLISSLAGHVGSPKLRPSQKPLLSKPFRAEFVSKVQAIGLPGFAKMRLRASMRLAGAYRPQAAAA